MTTTTRFLPTLLVALVLTACGGGSGSPAETAPPVTPVVTGSGTVTLATADFVASSLSSSTVGPAGGVLTVVGSADPLAGAVVSIPAGAVSELVVVGVSSAAVTSATGLPEGAAPRGRAVRVQLTTASTGAAVGALPKLVRITLPVDATTDSVSYYQIESGGVLEAMGFAGIDAGTHAISFLTRAPSLTGSVAAVSGAPRATISRAGPAATATQPLFATYVAIGVSQTTLARLASTQTVIDSGFRPSLNGFAQPNYGANYGDSHGGNCFGMAGFAKYYYQMAFTSPLADTYRDAQKSATWIDDSVAIELASRVHNQMNTIWNTIDQQELSLQTSWTAVANSLVGALYVTGKPTMIYLRQIVDGEDGGPAHAVTAYRAALHADGSVAFGIYDPNREKDDTAAITWSPAGGFDNYSSSTSTGAQLHAFNYFLQMGFSIGLTPDELARDKSDADAGYPASAFPTITITSIRGESLGDDLLANPGTTPEGLPSYKTTDTAVIIEGTVLGGNAQAAGHVVDSLNVFGADGLVQTVIDNEEGSGTGKFSVVVPVRAGLNPLALLASDLQIVTNWAAFKQVIIESDVGPSYFTATLTWNRGTSDVDLYVKEPDGRAGSPEAGEIGDVVFWAHREGVSDHNAYLDFDNTEGFGPENYLVKAGLTTLYADGQPAPAATGTYTIGVHYYSWNGDGDAPDRSVGWTVNWRRLKSCNNQCANPETDGLWISGSQSGTIAADDASQAGPTGFYAPGSAWSPKFQVDIPAATTSWTVPPSNTVMLP